MTSWMQRTFRSDGRRRAPTPADLLTIAVLLVLAVASAALMPHAVVSGVAVVRHAGGEERLPLDQDVVRHLDGPRGRTEVVVEDGAVRIAAAPCRLQLCVRMGETRSPTRSLICIPNQVRVRVMAKDREGDVDALSR